MGRALRFQLEGLHSGRRDDFGIIYRIGDPITIVAIGEEAQGFQRSQS